eukprot:CAMPEP_0197439178 /NCGR_PEP_ID=MMETSP1175-20131217/5984_1 /TAXON_ID=1003142 /ORGANISM="Triceratium dubium, Strain CCMP147" /LENGTH=916 /DNA_ID=CAMNT_0042969043 /DNA_START=547 /DNA_END=3297 /DNA_ORIENTATION=+
MDKSGGAAHQRSPPPRSALAPVLPHRVGKKVSFGISTLGILTEDGRDAFEVAASTAAAAEDDTSLADGHDGTQFEQASGPWTSAVVRAPVFTLPSPLHPVNVREYMIRNGVDSAVAEDQWPWSWSVMMQREEEGLARMKLDLELTDENLEEFRAILAGEQGFADDMSAVVNEGKKRDPAAGIIRVCGEMERGSKSRRKHRPHRSGLSPYRSTIRMPGFSPPVLEGNQYSQFVSEDQTNRNGLVLQSKLRRSFASMHGHSKFVKEDVLSIPSLCRDELRLPQHSHAREKLRTWGAERLLAMLEQLTVSYMLAALRRWSRAVELEKKAGKFRRYVKYQAVKKMELAELNMLRESFARAWWIWADGARRQRIAEIRALQLSAATAIQCWQRTQVARCLVGRLRERRKIQSALTLQRRARGMFARALAREIRRELRLESAAIRAQCLARRVSARAIFLARRREDLESKMAAVMQAVIRGRIGRKAAGKRRYEKMKDGAAAELQRFVRGRIGRRLAAEWKETVRRNSAAVFMQKIGRIYMAKLYVSRVREEHERRLMIWGQTALTVQRVYRGHRGRLAVRLQLKSRKAQIRKQRLAAVKLQSIWRGVMAGREVDRLRRDDQDDMMQTARQWQEMWSDDSETWFYYNADKNESLWEPPETGYTKADSRLVLKNGHVVDDPLVPKPADDENGNEEPKCVDCETANASRLCDQCGDGYCTACFIKAHPKGGRRESHTYVRIGPVECEECQSGVPAVRWCTSCDDPFCLKCWESIHKTGNRAQHAYCKIDGENVSPRAWTADGGELAGIFPGGRYAAAMNPQQGSGDYEQGLQQSQQMGVAAHSELQMQYEMQYNTGQADAGTSWSTQYDANGIPYCVDSLTGHSTYDSPWVQNGSGWGSTEQSGEFGGSNSQQAYGTELKYSAM